MAHVRHNVEMWCRFWLFCSLSVMVPALKGTRESTAPKKGAKSSTFLNRRRRAVHVWNSVRLDESAAVLSARAFWLSMISTVRGFACIHE